MAVEFIFSKIIIGIFTGSIKVVADKSLGQMEFIGKMGGGGSGAGGITSMGAAALGNIGGMASCITHPLLVSYGDINPSVCPFVFSAFQSLGGLRSQRSNATRGFKYP